MSWQMREQKEICLSLLPPLSLFFDLWISLRSGPLTPSYSVPIWDPSKRFYSSILGRWWMTSGTSPLSVIGAHALLSGCSIFHTHLDCCIPGRCILTLALILAGQALAQKTKRRQSATYLVSCFSTGKNRKVTWVHEFELNLSSVSRAHLKRQNRAKASNQGEWYQESWMILSSSGSSPTHNWNFFPFLTFCHSP